MNKLAVTGASILALLLISSAAMAKHHDARNRPAVKLYMSPASTVPSADIVKNLMYKCPNVTVTLNSRESDYMLQARWWPEHYRFTLFRKGGDAVFATTTILLSNAVKDVCKYVNTYPVPANPAPAKDGSGKPKPFKPSGSDGSTN